MNSNVKRYIPMDGLKRIIYFSLFLLAGCMTFDDPKDYQPSVPTSDKGRIYLYRIAPRITSGAWQDWILDGQWTGEIRPNTRYCVDIHVGRHIVRKGGSEKKVEFTLVTGQEVFVRFDVNSTLFGGEINPVIVDRAVAIKDFNRIGLEIDSARCTSK